MGLKFSVSATLFSILSFPILIWAQALPVGTSLMVNKGFEAGITTNWTVDKLNTSLNTTSPLFDSASLRLTRAPGGRAQIISAGLEAGGWYRLSGFGRVATPATDLATIGVEFYNVANVRLLNQWIQVKGDGTRQYTLDVQVPNGTSYVHVFTYKNIGNQPVDFDNFDFVKIAGP